MKNLITFVATVAIILGVQAQDYNKWSLDVKAGMNKPVTSFSMTPGYRTTTPSIGNIGAGFRYMFNNKFGIRLGADYNSFKNADDSKKFKASSIDINLQAVNNMGRVMNFEKWTKNFTLLTHFGVGVGLLSGDKLTEMDQVVSLHAGITPQFKLSKKMSLYLDVAVQMNGMQDKTFDTYSKANGIGLQGFNYTAALGLNFYLGGQEEHADWFYDMSEEEKLGLRIDDLESKLGNLANKVSDNEKLAGNNKSEIESLKNNVEKTYAKKSEVQGNIDVAKELINGGYVNVYYGFNSSKPNKYSLPAADIIVKYLEKNPNSNVNILGYADEIGRDNYNQKLSVRRAEAAKKLLINAGINANRITTEGKGVDSSVNKKSENARQLARRATFRVK